MFLSPGPYGPTRVLSCFCAPLYPPTLATPNSSLLSVTVRAHVVIASAAHTLQPFPLLSLRHFRSFFLQDMSFPALDDDFSKRIGAADSLDELKTKIR